MYRLISIGIISLLLNGCKPEGLYLHEHMGLHYSVLNLDGVPREIYVDSISKYRISELDSLIFCLYKQRCQSEENNYIDIFSKNNLYPKRENILYTYKFTYIDYELYLKSRKNKDSEVKLLNQKFKCE